MLLLVLFIGLTVSQFFNRSKDKLHALKWLYFWRQCRRNERWAMLDIEGKADRGATIGQVRISHAVSMMHLEMMWQRTDRFIFLSIHLLIVLTFFLLLYFSRIYIRYIKILSLISIVRNGSLTSDALKSVQLSSNLETNSSLDGIREHIFLHQHQSAKFALVVLDHKPPSLKVIDQVGMMSGNRNIFR